MKKLSEKIWETRKARINYEKRLLLYSRVSEFAIPWYSLLVIIISIIPIGFEKIIIDSVAICGSLTVLIISVIASSQDFKLQANSVKNQYITLDLLTSESARLEEASDHDGLLQCNQKYLDNLRNTSNHSYYDFLKVKIECYHRKKILSESQIANPTWIEWCRYIIHSIGVFIFLGFLFIGLPLVIYLLLK